MDKKLKLKAELFKKLKKETSATGTGASVTPGTGEGVATKYAFGKRNNKGTPKDWKSAPSIPNRSSKAMDYKELWEGELKPGVKYDYKGDSGFISTGGSNDPKNWKFLGDKGKYPYLAVKADLVPSKEQPGKYDGAFDIGMGKGHHIDEAMSIERDQEVKVISGPHAGKIAIVHDFDSEKDSASGEDWVDVLIGSKKEKKTVKASELKPLKEGYAQFRNATKTRSKPDQFHQAVKEIKKKMSEINRIFEYVDRLKTELSEGEDLKYKKYTENAFQQIKESAKQLFLKSTKLK